jgi:hypothetical protein
MSEQEQEKSGLGGLVMIAIALGILTIPVLIGILLSRDGGSGDGGGMGGDSESVAATVRPIAEVLDGEMVLEVDPSGEFAVLRLDTTVDMACSVVFGPTASFGSIATDTDMAGGGHRNHSPMLAGLQPGTTYLYRVQGTAPDGTVYVGELEQFQTPAADGVQRTNLALAGRVIEVSSEFSADWAGSNAIDGSLSTEWSSAGDGDDAYIVIDLGSAQQVSGIGFRTREMSDGTAITTSFTVTVDEGEPLGPFDSAPGMSVADVTFTGQVIRIDVATSTGGNTGAVEIEIYGA